MVYGQHPELEAVAVPVLVGCTEKSYLYTYFKMALTANIDLTALNAEQVIQIPRSKVAVAALTYVSGAGTLIMQASPDGGVTYVTVVGVDPSDTTKTAVAASLTGAGVIVADVSWATHVKIKKSAGSAACVGALNVNYSGGDM